MEQWRKNVYAIAVAQFIALGGGNLVFPFMPFFIEDLGIKDKGEVALWTGLAGTATGVMLFVFSPIWGALADRYGRKPLLLRAYLGATVTITLQGLCQNVWQLVLLRGLQGVFVGTIPAATALIVSSAPRERVAWSLGIMQMGLYVSQFAGPLAGGTLAPAIGFRETFFVTGVFYILSFVLVFFMVEERFEPPTAKERGAFWSNLREVADRRPLMMIIGVIFFLNLAPTFVRPVLPLVIDSFDPSISVESLSGITYAAISVTSAVSALMASRLSGRFGYRSALVMTTFAAGLAFLPVALATNTLSLIVLMAVVGLFSGAMVPTANALIDLLAPPGRQASAFGLSGSAMALAFATGPLSGGAVASAFGLHAGFVVVGVMLLLLSVAVVLFVGEPAAAGVGRTVEAGE
jgi:DHA1 family multidrug resistance protein-like MFS transporter